MLVEQWKGESGALPLYCSPHRPRLFNVGTVDFRADYLAGAGLTKVGGIGSVGATAVKPATVDQSEVHETIDARLDEASTRRREPWS